MHEQYEHFHSEPGPKHVGGLCAGTHDSQDYMQLVVGAAVSQSKRASIFSVKKYLVTIHGNVKFAKVFFVI